MWLIIHILVVSAVVLRTLSRDDITPITRLAWFMVMILVPALGVIIYFLLGEVNLGRAINARHQQVFQTIKSKYPAIFGSSNYEGVIEAGYQPAFHYASSINGFSLTQGNRAELMPDAETARSRLIADIDAAQQEVHVLYYIWLNDQTGESVAKALIRAAKRGISCKAMADGLGSGTFIKSGLWQAMQDAGVTVSIALPLNHIIRTLIQSRIDLRNHRKITVIDGNITYCGSQNCADSEFRVKPKFAPWIDILLRFEGPIVAQNQLLFASDWLINNENTTLDEFIINTSVKKGGFPALVWGDGPTERSKATPQMFANLFYLAKNNITVSTPYFVPDETVIKAISAAAYRGVDVSIIFPAANDSWIVGATSRSYYRELLLSGVKIYEFNGGLLHSKTLTIDGVITLVGSSNMDLRSFDLNYENNILLRDEEVTLSVYERQKSYILSSRAVTLSMVNNWSLPKRIWNNVIATIGPVL